ncbi:hypothetical protein [Shimia sp.]|uniref:hypothetical protein n=1 Tax=Shimia sp. TaxID=1954381 RepID=UPI003BADAD56
MSIPTRNQAVKQGNTGTVRNAKGIVCGVRDAALLGLSGVDVHFFAYWQNQMQLKLSLSASELTVDAAAGVITIPIDVDTFRNVTPGTRVIYEIEWRRGDEQRTILQGDIEVLAGINDD